MKYIETDWDLPYYNFALEDYLLQQAPLDDYLFFYVHRPSIIVGKFQNTLEEVNQDFVQDEDIVVARRLSGGGAVYHDQGNLNFSFVHPADHADMNNFKKFTQPVVDALQSLGLDAHLSGRNDILIGDKKVSGNAQCYAKGRILHHGTLLFDADMSNLAKSLKVKDLKISSKGIKSVRSRVTNITDELKSPMSIQAFQDYLLETFKTERDISPYTLSPEAQAYIDKKAELFSSWDWNWGKSPKYSLDKTQKFTCGLINAKINVNKGVIQDLRIFGDFFTSQPLAGLEEALRDVPFHRPALKEALAPLDISDYFQGLKTDDFLDLLLS